MVDCHVTGDWISSDSWIFMHHAVPTIEHLIPLIQPWDMDDEEALKLSGIEQHAFGGNECDFSKYLMNSKGTAPCALHAWGNQMIACPCGCLATAFRHIAWLRRASLDSLSRVRRIVKGSHISDTFTLVRQWLSMEWIRPWILVLNPDWPCQR